MPGVAHQGSPPAAAKTWGLLGARHDANPLQMETGSPKQHLGRKGAVMFTAGSRNAIEQQKKRSKGKNSKSGKLTNGRLYIEGMFILTVLLSTRRPQTGFLGSLSKDCAQLRTLPFHNFSIGNERNVPVIVFVCQSQLLLHFNVSPFDHCCIFFYLQSVHPSAQLLLAINSVKRRVSNILCSVKSFNFFKDDTFLT